MNADIKRLTAGKDRIPARDYNQMAEVVEAVCRSSGPNFFFDHDGFHFRRTATEESAKKGQWYTFASSEVRNPSVTYPLKPCGHLLLVTPDDTGYCFVPELPAGSVTRIRGHIYNVYGEVVTAGSVAIYARHGEQADTRADGDVDTWTDSGSLLTLDSTHHTNADMAVGTPFALTLGQALGCKAVTNNAFAVNGDMMLVVDLYYEESA